MILATRPSAETAVEAAPASSPRSSRDLIYRRELRRARAARPALFSCGRIGTAGEARHGQPLGRPRVP
eukprot:gene53960-73847_t